ncbi:polyprenyl synthetase family protein [Acidobacteria bacterium AH-259-D05]|nr:polyprenyl synthetase family protein [Acidobacteria bacterium AH-259-D05]
MNSGTTPVLKDDLPIQEYLRRQKRTVDKHLGDFLPPLHSPPEIIHQAMHYSIFAGGKRIRPVLVLATGEALDGDFHKLLYLACALEMVHTYSLVHDDLPAMDDDDYRRGQPSTHRKFGEGIAILAGNALLIQAFQLLLQIPVSADEKDTKISVIREICEATGTTRGMLGGQAMDLTNQGKPFSPEQLEQIHSAKTGALISASVSSAALLSGASHQAQERLRAYGSRIGLAFQIVDDILDIESSSKESGKTSGKDNLHRKATYPDMYGLEASRKMATGLVDEAIQEIDFLGSRGEILKGLGQFISVRRF